MNTASSTAPNGASSGLASVTRGKLDTPPRVTIYGPEGVGKSTFAANAPAPLFVTTEDGTDQLEVDRLRARDWQSILSLTTELRVTPHGYRTLVLDTLDGAEPLCWEYVCRAAGKKRLDQFDYGAGYVAAVTEWRNLLACFDRLRERGMQIVLLAHARVGTFKNPEGSDYDRYSLKLHDKSAAAIKEWSDAVLFANYETTILEEHRRTRGVDSGARLLHTTRRAAFDAKNRYQLPELLPLAWDELAANLHAKSPQAMRAAITELVHELPGDLAVQATAALARAGDDVSELALLANWVRAKREIEQRNITDGESQGSKEETT